MPSGYAACPVETGAAPIGQKLCVELWAHEFGQYTVGDAQGPFLTADQYAEWRETDGSVTLRVGNILYPLTPEVDSALAVAEQMEDGIPAEAIPGLKATSKIVYPFAYGLDVLVHQDRSQKVNPDERAIPLWLHYEASRELTIAQSGLQGSADVIRAIGISPEHVHYWKPGKP